MVTLVMVNGSKSIDAGGMKATAELVRSRANAGYAKMRRDGAVLIGPEIVTENGLMRPRQLIYANVPGSSAQSGCLS